MDSKIIVRGYDNKPAALVEIERRGSIVYVASARSLARVEAGESYPLGVRESDVFPWSDETFATLLRQWNDGGREEIWSVFHT